MIGRPEGPSSGAKDTAILLGRGRPKTHISSTFRLNHTRKNLNYDSLFLPHYRAHKCVEANPAECRRIGGVVGAEDDLVERTSAPPQRHRIVGRDLVERLTALNPRHQIRCFLGGQGGLQPLWH